jgi:DNA helicase HerA-like ATPase
MAYSEPTEDSYLVVGWQVTPSGEPQYWGDAKAKPGSPNQEKHLVRIPAGTMGSHTAIIAQSGSGKSFFLGRLIEELMLRTRSHCIVLDPNADFRQIDKIEDEALWSEARYDSVKRRGKLPHESSRKEFEKQWSNVAIRIRGRSQGRPRANHEQLTLWWPALSVEFLGEDLNPMLRSDLYHCHAFVQALETLWKHTSRKPKNPVNLFAEAQKLFAAARNLSPQELRSRLEQDFLTRNERESLSGKKPVDARRSKLRRLIDTLRLNQIHDATERVLAATEYVSEEVERFYFGKAREYMASGILDTVIGSRSASAATERRLQVIDLPSLHDKSTRLLAVNALLTTVWKEARTAWDNALKASEDSDTRVPTFVVVDEAHNLIPAAPRTRAETALTEQFRTITAEGRKYGLFLVLVSQRPDKLDSLILSECENKAIMKLGSTSVLNTTRQMLGLEDMPSGLLEKCLAFEKGQVLLTGRWVPDGPQTLYTAARRTKEGGRNLRETYWATPEA